jgi:multiple sugar transport system substrate-binding protein
VRHAREPSSLDGAACRFSSGSATQNTKTGPVKLTVMIGSSGDAETTAVKAATAVWTAKSGNTVEAKG